MEHHFTPEQSSQAGQFAHLKHLSRILWANIDTHLTSGAQRGCIGQGDAILSGWCRQRSSGADLNAGQASGATFCP
jgi:hypothetical protein